MSKFLIESTMMIDDANGPCYEDTQIEIFEGDYPKVKQEIINRMSLRHSKEASATHDYDLIGTSTNIKVYELRECYIMTDALLNLGQL